MPNGEKKYTLRLEIFRVVTRGNNKIIFLTCRTFLTHFEMEDEKLCRNVYKLKCQMSQCQK
jgi:hypothetical protein